MTVRPQVRTIAGWLIAIVIIVGAAFFVGRLGSPDAPAGGGDASASATPSVLPIVFGTALDPATGEVAADLRTARFGAGDTFAYSVRPPGLAGTAQVYVEVLRIGADESSAPVQTPAPQDILGAEVIAFDPPADLLLADFGPGTYLMRIYLEPGAAPIAEGQFELVAAVPS